MLTASAPTASSTSLAGTRSSPGRAVESGLPRPVLATSQCMDSVPEDDMEAIAELIDAALALARADWFVRNQCGLRRFYGLLRVLRRRVRRRQTCENLVWLRLGRTDDLRIQHP